MERLRQQGDAGRMRLSSPLVVGDKLGATYLVKKYSLVRASLIIVKVRLARLR